MNAAPASPRRETPEEHVARVRRDVREGRRTPQEVIFICNRQLPPARASKVIATILQPELW